LSHKNKVGEAFVCLTHDENTGGIFVYIGYHTDCAYITGYTVLLFTERQIYDESLDEILKV